MKIRSLAILVILLATPLLCTLAAEDSAAGAASSKADVLTDDAIVEMQNMNLGDSVILEKIKTSTCNFDVSLKGLKQLKEAKVSNAVIQAMVATKSASSTSTVSPEVVSSGDSNDPLAPHEIGVWRYEEANGQKKMTRMESESFRNWTAAGPFGGASRAVVTGLNAKLQVSSRKPVFYMYFGKEGQGLLGLNSPSQIPLAKLDLKAKTQERLLVIGSIAPFAGYNSGIKRESLRAVDETRLVEGIYKIVPREDLSDGEYAFCCMPASGMQSLGRMYCFGINAQ